MQDMEIRLAALAKLATSESRTVEQRLGEVLARAERVLDSSTDYEELVEGLKTAAVLAPKFHAAVLPLLTRFVEAVERRDLSSGGEPIDPVRSRHKSAAHLVREAIEATNPLRYLQTLELVDFLLPLSRSQNEEVAGKARRAFESLVEFDLNLFFGERGLGAQPQAAIVAHLASFEDGTLEANAELILVGLRAVLAASIEGRSWTYQTMTISQGSITSGRGVAALRQAAIALLKRMYSLSGAIEYRKNVLTSLGQAMRRERPAVDEETGAMFERDALEVLGFMEGLVATEPLPLVQSVEHRAYWNYYHAATPAISAAALKIRDAIDQRSEYQIYKQLIGFEGIFGPWEDLKRSEAAWDYGDEKRREFARRCVTEIDDNNEAKWRTRILKFSETRSDDLATFPVYYEFLELLGQQRPVLALELLTEHEEKMRPFQIALMMGLWSGPLRDQVAAVVDRWVAAGSHLVPVAKSLIKGGDRAVVALSAVLVKGVELEDDNAVVHAMGAAARLHGGGIVAAKEVFMHGVRELARRNDANWARAVWFNRDFKALIASMDAGERSEVLRSLASLKKLDYQAEEVLAAVCADEGALVLSVFMGRLRQEASEQGKQGRAEGEFEAIPEHLHQLSKVLREASRDLVHALRSEFDDEKFRGLFPYGGGAKLLEAVFPGFADPLPTLLLELVAAGAPGNIDFAVSVLRVFGGGAPILEVAKAIVKVVPEQSDTWSELSVALESTGVVMGEYGMAEAYERIRKELTSWSAEEDARVRAFARWLSEELDRVIAWERQRADETIELRKYRYGVGKGDA